MVTGLTSSKRCKSVEGKKAQTLAKTVQVGWNGLEKHHTFCTLSLSPPSNILQAPHTIGLLCVFLFAVGSCGSGLLSFWKKSARRKRFFDP